MPARPSQRQHALVKIDMAYLELMPEGLWHRHFYPRVLRIIGLEVNETVSPQEGSSLQKLFQPPPEKLALMQQEEQVPRAIPLQSPPSVAAVPPPGEPPPAVVTPPVPPASPAEQQQQQQAASERLALQEISIEQAHFHIINHGVDSQFNADISNFSIALTDIDIDPNDLTAHNRLHIRLAAKAVVDGVTKVGGQARQVRFADMTKAM